MEHKSHSIRMETNVVNGINGAHPDLNWETTGITQLQVSIKKKADLYISGIKYQFARNSKRILIHIYYISVKLCHYFYDLHNFLKVKLTDFVIKL